MPINLFGSWQGKVTAYKSGNTVAINVDTVSNSENDQILAHIPVELQPKGIVVGVIFDVTNKTSINRLSIAGNQLAICNFDFSGWYTVGHTYVGMVTYVI